MIFDPDYQSLILAFFVIQELIFALILFRKGIKEGVSSDLWLSLLLVLCALYMTPWMLGKMGWYALPSYRDFLFFIPFHQYFLFGPAMYFFTRQLTGEEVFLKKEWLHFIPATTYLLYSLVIAITDLLILDEYYFYQDGMDKDFKPWYQLVGLISMMIYAVFSTRTYMHYKHRIYQTFSYADLIKRRWLMEFLVSLVAIIILRGVFIVIFPTIGDWGFKWWYYLFFGIISYYLAVAGLMSSLRLSALKLNVIAPPPVRKLDEAVDSSNLKQVLEDINRLFEESKLYANAQLTLPQLAEAVSANTSVVSKAINEKAGMNFNDFVNTYRVSAVKQSLVSGAVNYKTLVGIAMDHGFNSKSTFIRSFKKLEGMTPSEFIKNSG